MEEKQEVYRPRIRVETLPDSEPNYACRFNTRIYLDDNPMQVKYFKMELSSSNVYEVTMTFIPKDVNVNLMDSKINVKE